MPTHGDWREHKMSQPRAMTLMGGNWMEPKTSWPGATRLLGGDRREPETSQLRATGRGPVQGAGQWRQPWPAGSVDAAGANHEQLQQDEDRRHDEAVPELARLLCQLLAQQHLEDELEAEQGEDPEEAQHGQALLAVLEQAHRHDGREVGAQPVSRKEGHEDHPPRQRRARARAVHLQHEQHGGGQQRQPVQQQLEGREAEPLHQLPQREQHRRDSRRAAAPPPEHFRRAPVSLPEAEVARCWLVQGSRTFSPVADSHTSGARCCRHRKRKQPDAGSAGVFGVLGCRAGVMSPGPERAERCFPSLVSL